MADDEPLDDLRAVAMTAGAAVARVVETVARAAQQQTEAAQRAHEDAVRRQQAQAAVEGLQPGESSTRPGGMSATVTREQQRQREQSELDTAREWARDSAPDVLGRYEMDYGYYDTAGGRDAAQRGLIREWEQATGEPAATAGASWDDTRGERDAAMAKAGVPEEARQARTTSDLLNGTDPQLAASAGFAKTGRWVHTRTPPGRERGR